MRKLLIVVALVGLMVFGSFAQMGNMSLGAKAGLTLGRMDTSEPLFLDVDEKFRMSIAFGGMMIMPLNKNMDLQGELMYVMKGEKLEESGEEATVKIDVLELPVLLKYKLNETMAIYGGPTLDFIMNAEIDLPDSDSVDIKDDLKSMGFGLSFGAQYKMDKILFDARYDLGISDIADSEDGEIKLNTIYLTVGYLF